MIMRSGVIDSPVKNQRPATNHNHEDSLVFGFIQGLSPIKPVKPVCVTQMVTSLTFGPLPSVFTSPQASLKHEQRLPNEHSELNSHHQQEVPSNNPRTCHENHATSVGVAHLDEYLSTRLQCEESALRFDATVITECGSDGLYGQSSIGSAALSAPIVPMVRQDHEQFESPTVKNDADMKKELFQWEWGNSMLDGNNMFVFNSRDGAEALKGLASRSPDLNRAFLNSLMPRFMQNEVVDAGKTNLVAQMNPYQQHTLLDSSSLIELMDNVNTARDYDSVRHPEDNVAMSLEQDLYYKPTPGFHRGLRRCLEFEMAVANKNYAPKDASNFMQLGDSRHHGDDPSLRRIVPGIGLHLNATAMNSNEHKHEHSSSNTRCTTMRISPVCLKLPGCTQVPSHGPLTLDMSQEGELFVEDDSPAYVDSYKERLDQCSLQWKRHKGENSGEKGACKRCNCKKSKCLKLYCECFAAGVFCTDPCTCQHCLNKPIHHNIVLETRKQIESRNPIAFAPKVISDLNSLDDNEVESSETPASARHKKGCNCKRSGCSKKYCECYQSGVGCSFNCRCEGCKNSFGRRDGSAGAITDSVAQAAEEDNKKHVKKAAHPTCRRTSSSLLCPLPFTSMSKRPRSSSLVMPTAMDQTNRLLGKLYFPGSWSKLENHSFTRSADHEVPRILRNSTNTPSYGLKRSSPNSKRVSPPNKGKVCFGSSAGHRMMLKSIPSFPSL